MGIAENQHHHLADFIRLNEEWISRYFAIEDADRALAANPRQVIDSGGYIFSLTLEDDVVGVCGLFSEGHGVYELATAIAMYRKYNFVTVTEGPHPLYARANIVMERCIP